MRIALLDVKKATGLNSKFTAVNVRNLLLIKNELKCDLFLFEKDLLTKTKYDVIIFGFNSIFTIPFDVSKIAIGSFFVSSFANKKSAKDKNANIIFFIVFSFNLVL